MKKLSYFILGLFVPIFGFFLYTLLTFNGQKISGEQVNFSSAVDSKVEELKNYINNLSIYGDRKNSGTYSNLNGFENEKKIEKFYEIKSFLDSNYIKPSAISGSKMWDNAMQAFVSAIGDPFTVYLTSKDNKSLQEGLKGNSDFEGIGAIVTKVPNGIMIEKLIKNGPAFNSGLKPLDVIIKANGNSLVNLPLGEAVNKIKGPEGTEVKLLIRRNGKILEKNVVRDKIELKSVESEVMDYKGQKIGYLTISSIGETTFSQFRNQVDKILDDGIDGIVLDLRGNGGGFLDIGYKVGTYWAKKGDVIVKTKYKKEIRNKSLESNINGKLNGFPTVVLMDSYTASAGEIIVGAIKENNKAKTKLVGQQTFGKGTIQTLQEFQDGSSLKYTIGKWFTPDGKNVSDGIKPGNGISPDIEVEFDRDSYKKDLIDTQLEKAKEILSDIINK